MNEEWIDSFIEKLAEHEGTEGRKVAIEGGKGTRGYGITHIAEGLKKFLSLSELQADEMSDKDLAKQIVLYNIGQIKNQIGEEKWNNLPNSMKMIASDMYYNAGKLFPGFKRDLVNGDYESALKNTLDIVLANDPKTGQSAILNGLINRRVDWYNIAAQELGLNTINNFDISDSIVEGKKTAINYNYSDGSAFTIDSKADMHSQSLKKTDKFLLGERKSLLSDEAQSALNNVIEAVPEMANQVGETLDGVNITGLETEDIVPGDKPVDQFSVKKDEFLFNSSEELRNKIENDRKEIEKYDPLAGHKNPSFVSPLVEGTYDVISDQDQSIIDNQNLKAQKLLAEKYSIGDISKAAIDSEWVANNVWKMANREELPNHDFHVTDFLPTKKQKEDLINGVNEEYHDMLLFNRDGKTLPELYQLKNKLIEIQEREQILMSKGIATGITARLLAAVLDPVAWGAAIASEGILAPAIIMNKASRLTRIIRAGFAAGATNAAIETILMQENPTLDIDDFAIAVGAGFVLGGTLRGLKKIDPNEQALHRAVDEFVNGKEKEMVENSGLKLTTKGNKKYKVQKTEQDDHNLTVEDYKNTLPSRTTIRTDGNKEIKTPDGKDEYIVTKDGEVIKCK